MSGMMLTSPDYDEGMLENCGLKELKSETITKMLDKYLGEYDSVYSNKSHKRYVDVYVQGLLSELDRKSIEPIALNSLGEIGVRPLQQFFKRAPLNDEALLERYQELLSNRISAAGGMLSVDESDFTKKGEYSAGVSRQYCGRLGKTDNCQAGVFVAYASEQGYGLVDRQLYIPEKWFGSDYEAKRKRCHIPEKMTFTNKNEIALSLLNKALESNRFCVKWIGCDAAYGCDHDFLQGLPDNIYYFASTKSNELIFRQMPEMQIPNSIGKNGRPYKHAKPLQGPVKVKTIAEDDALPWKQIVLAEGAKGPIMAQVKYLRCVSCYSTTKYGNYVAPDIEVWLYIRRHEDGTIKYALCNAPANLPISELHSAATMRWPIEQCFQECKSFLGMGHYETQSFQSWHRHMLLVMIAHLFTTLLRQSFKKTAAL